jgi:hypothetical protein
MTLLRGIGRFVYDFVIGDDWKIAAGVVIALLAGAFMSLVGVPATVTTLITAGLLATTFTAALVIDVRGTVRR